MNGISQSEELTEKLVVIVFKKLEMMMTDSGEKVEG